MVSGLLSARRYSLLNHFLKLLTDYRSIKAIAGNACLAVARRKRACHAVGRRGDRRRVRRVKPVAFFAFDHWREGLTFAHDKGKLFSEEEHECA